MRSNDDTMSASVVFYNFENDYGVKLTDTDLSTISQNNRACCSVDEERDEDP